MKRFTATTTTFLIGVGKGKTNAIGALIGNSIVAISPDLNPIDKKWAYAKIFAELKIVLLILLLHPLYRNHINLQFFLNY